MKNRTFILGAGFSAGAGVPLTAELLSVAMNKFEKECNGVYQRIESYARQCFQIKDEERVDYSKVGFSELCTFLEFVELREYAGGERWSSNGSREKVNFRYYLAKTLIEMTPEGAEIPALYIEFASELHEGDVILSFNWDPLLERALELVKKEYSYIYEDKKINICKLHGSVNWRLGEVPDYLKSEVDLEWEPFGFSKGMMDVEMYSSNKLLHKSNWLEGFRISEVDPFLVLPGYGKAFDVRANAVFWYKPEFFFATTQDVYIIGLSLAPDDFFIRSFFLANLPDISSSSSYGSKTIHIVNPSEEVFENFAFIAKSPSCKIHKECFSEKHIKLMQGCSA